MMERERILVVVSASNGALGKIIRKLTGSPVNHCFLLYESAMWKGWWAAQIGLEGVQKLPAEKVKGKYSMCECYSYRGDLTPGVQKCRKMVGERYDFLGILGFLIKLLVWRLTGRRIKNPLHGKHEEFCSEFVASVLKEARIRDFLDCDPASLSPGDVRDKILSYELFQRVEWPER